VSAAAGLGATGAQGRITVAVNGEPVHLPEGSTVADVVAALGLVGRGVAVAVGREVVPRSAWSTMALGDGAVVEVVTAAAGG